MENDDKILQLLQGSDETKEIGQLTSLKTLNLKNNKLVILPPEIGQLTKLKILNLQNNELTWLPSEIGQLTHLKLLDLSHNPLSFTEGERIRKLLPQPA